LLDSDHVREIPRSESPFNGNKSFHDRYMSQYLAFRDVYVKLRPCKYFSVPDFPMGCKPLGRPSGASTAWTNAMLTPQTDTTPPRVVLTRPDGVPPGCPGPQTCTADISSFYDPRITQLKTDFPEIWFAAEIDCASRSWGTPLPTFDLNKTCYQGRIGDAANNMLAAMHAAKVVLTRYALTIGRKEKMMSSCLAIQMGNATLKAALDRYLSVKETWTAAAGVVSSITSVVQFALSPGTSGVALASNFLDAGGGVLGGMAQTAISGAEGEYQRLVQEISAFRDKIECGVQLDTIERELVELSLQIKGQADVVDAEIAKLRNRINENKLALSTGQATLAREETRLETDIAHNLWFDEKVDRFKKELAWAKQLTFLAMRAVEFEMQQSLPHRQKIVVATHPDQLDDVLRSLKQEQATRSINRKRPEESSIVLSVRDDVLEIADRSDAPMGERNWTPAMRFQGRLWDDIYSVRDQNGQWLGQGVPFAVAEKAVLKTRCGERLWRVTATVQGDGLSPLEPGTPLMLLKRNTFSSQFCAGRGDGAAFQVASIRPSNQLFKGKVEGNGDEVNEFSTAMIYPWFNVRRHDFYATDYRKGASEELAGRGLYGDYILLFPKEVLDKGFPLENVEDVLLRIDYLSVDNLPKVSAEGRAGAKMGQESSLDLMSLPH
jgi:hypothetical protein